MSFFKTYSIQEDEFNVDFIGDFPAGSGDGSELIITDISALKAGLDNITSDDASVYPGNIEIKIDGIHFDLFNNLYGRYNNIYPFNYEEILYLRIKKNGNLIFKGYLEKIYKQGIISPDITLRFTDGINKLKNVTMGNPYLLDLLYSKGMIRRYKYNNTNTLVGDIYVYGFGPGGSITFAPNTYTFQPDYPYRPGSVYDKNVNLQAVIEELFKVLSPGITVEFDTRLKFKGRTSAYEAEFNELFVRYVSSNLFGRYIVMKKGPFNTTRDFGITNNGADDYNTYTVIFDDGTYKVFYHEYKGVVPYVDPEPPHAPAFKYFNKGIGPVKLNEFLKTIAKNFFARFEFYAPGKVKWYHKKRAEAEDFESIDHIIDYQEESPDIAAEGVKLTDMYNGLEGATGSAGVNSVLEDYQKIEFSLPFTAFELPYDEEERLYFLNNGDSPGAEEIDAVKMKVEANGGYEYIQRALAKAEYNKQFIQTGRTDKKLRPKRTIIAPGTDYVLYKNYEFPHDGIIKNIKPVQIEKYEISGDKKMKGNTRITGVAVTR